MLYDNILQCIGGTPMVRLSRFCEAYDLESVLYAKLEKFNPGGSSKDRVALNMIESAEQEGRISFGATIIEPTSGNTGIGLAVVCAVKGYRLILTMPESMSIERRKLLSALGAEIVLTPASKGMTGAVEEAEELHSRTPNSYIPGQFSNPANPDAHFVGTGPEIWNDMGGELDAFVAGIGTGGTLSGTGMYLKSMNGNILTVGIEPETSPLISKGFSGKHNLQGIGANFIPDNYHAAFVDRILTVSDQDAYEHARNLSKREGIFTGISSGAVLAASVRLAKETGMKKIVCLLPDSGDRYLSTELVL